MSFHWEDSTSGLNSNSVRIQSEKAGRPRPPRPEKFDAPSSQERRPLFQPIEGGWQAIAASVSDANPRKVPDAVNENGRGASIQSPRVYSAWIDDYSDDLYQCAEPSYTPRSTFSERVAEIALGGFILLAVVCGLARWF